jgi:hypothetical protein
MTSIPMIIRCYQHQHPEDYARAYIDEPWIPEWIRYGRDDFPASRQALAEEPMGIYCPSPPVSP